MENQVMDVVTNEGIEVCSVMSKRGLITKAAIGLAITGVVTFGIVKLVKRMKARKQDKIEEASVEAIEPAKMKK